MNQSACAHFCQHRLSLTGFGRGGFALIESMIGMGIVTLMLSGLFAMNGHLMGLLKQGKESIYATQMIQERTDVLRTILWDEVTDPARLATVIEPATGTSANLRGVTETITVVPLVNTSGVQAQCVRTPGATGTVTPSGTILTAENSVKVTVSLQWTNRGRTRSRESTTILTKGGI